MCKDTVRRLLVLALVVPLVLAACAAPTPQVIQQTVVVPVQQTVIVPQTPVPPAPKTIITLAYNGYFNQTFGPALPPIQALNAELAKTYPNIQVNLNVMPYDSNAMHDTYVAWFQGQDPTMDLIGVSNYWLPEFAAAGWLLPLTGQIDPKVLAQIYPADLQAFSYNGTLYALGPWWGGIGGLYYRKDLLAKYNLQPPTTYDELLADVKTIQAGEPGIAGWTMPLLKEETIVNRWMEFLYGFGGVPFDASGKCAMNNAQGVQALTFMVNLINSGVTPKAALTWKEEDSETLFISGKAIFHSGRQDMTTWLDDPKQSSIGGKWGFIPDLSEPPLGHSAGFLEAWAFGINKYSKHPVEAAEVLDVMNSFNVQKTFAISQGVIQGNMEVMKDPDVIKDTPDIGDIANVVNTAVTLPTPKFDDISLILQDDLTSALSGQTSPTAALNDACQRIDALK